MVPGGKEKNRRDEKKENPFSARLAGAKVFGEGWNRKELQADKKDIGNDHKATPDNVVYAPRGFFLSASMYNQQKSLPFVTSVQNSNYKQLQTLQNNRNFQASPSPLLARQGITVNNHNKFVTTINGDSRNPQTMYSNFTSSVNKVLSNLTSEAITRHLGSK